jgi:hypothetical protein
VTSTCTSITYSLSLSLSLPLSLSISLVSKCFSYQITHNRCKEVKICELESSMISNVSVVFLVYMLYSDTKIWSISRFVSIILINILIFSVCFYDFNFDICSFFIFYYYWWLFKWKLINLWKLIVGEIVLFAV